jgi:shikimate dehydrogenase
VNVAALIGSPVGHSLSPVIHQAAFDAAGIDWRYVAFDVPAGEADLALSAMRVLGISGLSVTTPHKEQVAACVDVLEPEASLLGAANTVVVDFGGQLIGHNTDGHGFVAALRHDGIEIEGMNVAVLGAGAAARSVIAAVDVAKAADIVVINRTRRNAERALSVARGYARLPSGDVNDELARADLIVNATTVGFDSELLPLDPAVLRPGQLVADLVYHPLETALLRAARAVGARTIDGLGMLIHQAALQQMLWVGYEPDVTVMRAAAEAELARRAA